MLMDEKLLELGNIYLWPPYWRADQLAKLKGGVRTTHNLNLHGKCALLLPYAHVW